MPSQFPTTNLTLQDVIALHQERERRNARVITACRESEFVPRVPQHERGDLP